MKKKRSFSIKLNKNKKNKNIVLLVIASVVAAVGTAVFGILQWKGKKNAHGESKVTVKITASKESSIPKDSATTEVSSTSNASAVPKPQPPARFAHRKLKQGELDWEQLAKEKEAEQIRRGEIPEHMLADVEKPRRGVKRGKWKIALSGIATLLAVAVVSSNIAQYLRPSEAMAKESFAGIGKIVAEHDEGNPYKILNIVPSKVMISTSNLDDTTGSDDTTTPDPDDQDSEVPVPTSFTFSTGTMGYLAGGKVPFADELETAFKGNPIFSHYTSREELFNKLVPSPDSFPQIKYAEAYGGVHNVSETNGWTLLFPADPNVTADSITSGNIPTEMASGAFWGKAVKYVSGEKTGYDFISLGNSNTSMANEMTNFIGEFVYVWLEDHYITISLDQLAGFPEDTAVFKVTGIKEVYSLEDCSAEEYVYKYDEENRAFFPVDRAGVIFGHDNSNDGDNGDVTNKGGNDDVTDKGGNDDVTNNGGNDDVTDNGGNDDVANSGGDDDVTNSGGDDDVTDNGGDDDVTDDGGDDDVTDTGGDDDVTNTGGDGDVTNTGGNGNVTNNGDDIDDGDVSEESTGNVGNDGTKAALLDITRNTAFTGGWRTLAEDGSVSSDINTVPNADTIVVSPDENTTSTDTDNLQEELIANPSESDGLSESDALLEEDELKAEESTEGDSESNIPYYVITDVEQIGLAGDAELFDSDISDDGVLDDEESNGISLHDSSLGIDATYIYVGSGQGDYKLIEDKKSGIHIGIYNAPVYFRCQAGNDWLRQYVFNSLAGGDNEKSSFRIEVTTVRADEVKAEMVYDADLIYMESGQNMFLNPSLAVGYIQHAEDDLLLGDTNDMSADVVSAILSRVSDELMPIIVDYEITKETDTSKYAGTNYQLLAKALLKRDLAGYFEAVNKDADHLMINIEMNLEADEYPDKIDNNYNYVNQNVYVINDEKMLVSDDFAAFFEDSKAKSGFNDVLMAIEAENTTLAEEDRISLKVSKARAVQYIINFSVGIMGEFNDLTILELQPTANIDFATGGVSSDLHRDNENTKLYWKTESMNTGKQILYSKKPFSINTDVKSVVEFNGEWEDINGTYDMIFIGLDGRNLNLGNEKPRRPIYNNDDLNGKVYHTGDESGSGTYDSNDITAQKMTDLLEYLQAGYPIVVENDCFKDGTARGVSEDSINTKYIAEDTVMYKFLSVAVSDERYNGSIFTVSDTVSSALFMVRIKTAKPRIELIDEDNAGNGQDSKASQELSRVQALALDENNEYHGKIAFEIKNNRGEEYLGSTQLRLYADMNYDGIFGIEEELTEGYVNEGNVIDVTISGMGPGIIPWKLEVADEGNEYRRDSVQGYFKLVSSYAEEVRVLQVTGKKGDFDVDLQAMYDKKNDSMLARYLKDAESNSNLDFEIETITPDTLSARLGENAKYLNQWDVVVLTVDDGVSVDSAAFTNYINEGRSLLVCSQNKGGNSAGITSELLGWSNEGRTFVSLGASNLHRYADLKHEMYVVQSGSNLKAEKINEGSILYYPYQMDGNSFNFGNTESGLRASEYLLDFDNNLKSETTAAYVTTWITLGGSLDTAYGISPRDARNNYYCYSKGNVVYLAQSEYHYSYDAANNEVPEGNEGADECKFFVNALMAAYSAGVHNSDVSMVSGFANTSTTVKSISVPFDQEWRQTADDGTQGILDDTVDVYFKFADSNIGANKKVKVSFYYEDPAGTQEFAVGDTIVKATPFGSDIWTVTDNKLVQVASSDPQNPDQVSLVPGKVYQIKAPVVSLRMLTDEKTNDAGIYVLVESEFIRTGKTYKIDGFATVSLNRAKLFLLE